MSLSARERRTLDSIKEGLADSDPQLIALLVTFNRLASDEAMPVREKIRAGLSQPTCYSDGEWRHPQRREAGPHARWVNQHLSLRWTAPVLWLLMTISLIVVALVLSHTSGGGTCTKPWATVCSSSASAHSSHPSPATEVDHDAHPPTG